MSKCTSGCVGALWHHCWVWLLVQQTWTCLKKKVNPTKYQKHRSFFFFQRPQVRHHSLLSSVSLVCVEIQTKTVSGHKIEGTKLQNMRSWKTSNLKTVLHIILMKLLVLIISNTFHCSNSFPRISPQISSHITVDVSEPQQQAGKHWSLC